MNVDAILTSVIVLIGLGVLVAYLWYISGGDPRKLLTDEDLRKKAPIAAAIVGLVSFILTLVVSNVLRSYRKEKVDKVIKDYNDSKAKTDQDIARLQGQEEEIEKDIDAAHKAAEDAKKEADNLAGRMDAHLDNADGYGSDAEDALARADRIKAERERQS